MANPYLEHESVLAYREVDAERVLLVVPLTYGRARLHLAYLDQLPSLADGW